MSQHEFIWSGHQIYYESADLKLPFLLLLIRAENRTKTINNTEKKSKWKMKLAVIYVTNQATVNQ